MGPMVKDESKMQKVILFIQSLRHENTELPTMSFEELNDCMPLDEAFAQLRSNVENSYGL